MPPWEKYQPATEVAGPWKKYGPSTPATDYKPEVSVGRTVLDQGLQGATFGFADEITDRLGAGLASVATGEKYDDLLKEARGLSKERMAAEFEQNPGTAIAANLAGGLLTGGAGATTKTGTFVANSLRTGNAATRVAKGVAAGAASGGLYGAGTAEEGNRLEGAGQGALVGGAVGGAIPAVGAAVSAGYKGTKNAITGATSRGIDELDDALGAIKAESTKAYTAMRDAGAVINRNRAVNIANQVEKAIRNDGKLNSSLHANTLSVLDDFKNAAKQGSFTLEELDQWRQLFGEVAGNFTDKINGRKASIAIEAIDDAVDNLSKIDIRGGRIDAVEALNKGRAEWAKARKFESISNIIKKSEGDANYLKRELKKLLDNPKKVRGFSEGERAALREAATLTAGEGILKSLGKLGFDLGGSRIGNTLSPLVGGTVGLSFAGATGAGVVPIAGTAARQGQKYIARGKAEKLLNVIEGGAPAKPGMTPVTPLGSIPGGGAAGAIATQPSAPAMQPQRVLQVSPQSLTYQEPATEKPAANAPLGIRNNNPGNLRPTGDRWQGMKGVNKGFIQFQSPDDGLRALAKNLATQQRKHGIDTIGELVHKYAPPSENNTKAYTAALVKELGIAPDQQINLTEPDTLLSLMTAIVRHENGTQPYRPEQMRQAIARALSA